ncbi:MAG: ABC transporter substrate-binding protein [Sandaracinaceae bacterium]
MEQLKIGLEWFLNPDHVPFLVALERGWFREAGLDVTLVEPEGHLDAFEAIARGELDVAITEPLHLVEDAAKGRTAVGFARFLHTNGGVMFLKGSGIERPRDMVGKRVQYPGAPGPGGLAVVSTMIEADGGRPEGLTPVNRGFQHTDALLEGEADVATLAFRNFEVVEATHRGREAGFFALKDWGIPDFCQLVLFTSRDALAERLGALQRMVAVLRRGIDAIHEEPTEARAVYFRRTETDPEDPLMSAIFAATVPCFTFDLTLSSDYLDALARWMHARGLVERRVSPEQLWRNDLVLPSRGA